MNPCAGNRRVRYHSHYYQAFVDSVRDRSASVAPIEDAVRSDALSHLSLLAMKSGAEVVWNPQHYKIQSPKALNRELHAPIRGEWKQV